jgi:hypothetical protein
MECLGFLFLNGGQASLRRDNFAIGCLLLSVIPRFPNRTIDNQYHLQAFRHLYMLSVEWRSLRIADVDTGLAVQGLDVEVSEVCVLCITYEDFHYRSSYVMEL